VQGTRVNINSINVAKACAQVGNIIPAGGVHNDEFLLSFQPEEARGGSQMSSARGPSQMEIEVGQDIHRRIEILGQNGKMFEDGAAYTNKAQDAVDAMHIVRGIDPATVNNPSGGGGFMVRRKIPIEKRHWMACKQGFYHNKYGVAYVHTDGSICMIQQGKELSCKCGAVHMA
jgi:hypothetical protein